MNRRLSSSLTAAAIAAVLATAGCGGGGGGSSAAPPIGNNPTPFPTSTASSITPSGVGTSYTIDSNPRGLTVAIDGAASGVTPQTYTPAARVTAHTVTIGGTYSVTLTPNFTTSRTIYYNRPGETAGSVTASSIQTLQNAARSLSSIGNGESLVRRPLQSSRGLAGVSSTRVAVTYNLAALHSAGRAPADIERAQGAESGSDISRSESESVRSVAIPSGTTLAAFTAQLSANREVASVTPLHLRSLQSSTPITPNDTYMKPNYQWDMFQIGMPNAWGYTKGDTAKIAVIDTGYDKNHQDLMGKVAYSESVINGVRTVNSAQDTDGHGTNVSGIAAATTNNGFGFAGVGWNTQLYEFKIFSDATSANSNISANTGDEATAINDAVAQGVDVINLSLGATQDTGFDQVEYNAVESAISQGVVVVAASGNEAQSSGATTVDYPAAYPGVISVGATSLNDGNTGNPQGATEFVASYSNAGPGLDVVAPGGDPNANDTSASNTPTDYLHWIFNISTTTAAVKANQCLDVTNCKALFAGTSQATPHVAGAVALLAASAGHRALSPARVSQIIDSTADNINDPKQGHGRLNVYRALAASRNDTTGITYTPAPTQFVAFAYTNSGGTTPSILDITYPSGVPVGGNGTFDIGDLPAGASNYRIAVWFDANGNGKIDPGDEFGVSGVCPANASCPSAQNITVSKVGAGFALP